MGEEIRVLYFGTARETTGKNEELLTAEDTADLRHQLIQKYPALGKIPFRMALNKELLKADAPLNNNDIIAILPPFQGG
ncbi:MAG: MoaD/ThiS family protein [Bacteroidales bacterium]|nr:MoaD/ThiS family protein [Bacteroidales bacterium]NLD63383.1 MoaD/ThiS family protein [Bacteroidales bacterium]HNT92442.1 MoaD/ThiS family protein [Bacteroidales bacterium]HOO65698.1 MoaD/ThiS family protein [Bacteroidales bacterium]HPE21671.1 MoaD/ThiS family protein [Bacteroidales bacterium]